MEKAFKYWDAALERKVPAVTVRGVPLFAHLVWRSHDAELGRIPATGMPRIASQNAPTAAPQSLEETVFFKRFD
jgi:hypothetical protein